MRSGVWHITNSYARVMKPVQNIRDVESPRLLGFWVDEGGKGGGLNKFKTPIEDSLDKSINLLLRLSQRGSDGIRRMGSVLLMWLFASSVTLSDEGLGILFVLMVVYHTTNI